MKKLTAIASSALYLLSATGAFAQTSIMIATPEAGYKNLGLFIGNVLTILFAIAVLVVLFMLVWGAYEWITSGGDKEAIGKARGRILNALIGLAVLSVAFALAAVAAQFLGFNNITNITIPAPG
jgi:hypothetical protein